MNNRNAINGMSYVNWTADIIDQSQDKSFKTIDYLSKPTFIPPKTRDEMDEKLKKLSSITVKVFGNTNDTGIVDMINIHRSFMNLYNPAFSEKWTPERSFMYPMVIRRYVSVVVRKMGIKNFSEETGLLENLEEFVRTIRLNVDHLTPDLFFVNFIIESLRNVVITIPPKSYSFP